MPPKPGADSLSLLDEGPVKGPDYSFELMLAGRGRRKIAGVDEAGRGPLAGPVVAAAVILDPGNIPDGINDSKAMTRAARERLFIDITQNARVAWCAVRAEEIDRINILQATFVAMCRAVSMLGTEPDSCLIDGRDVPSGLRHFGQSIVRGDALCLSIAAASIVAKVVRDAMMLEADARWPQYGFATNAGYGTAEHMLALQEAGPCPLHRHSFAPVAQSRAARAMVSA
ncbi:MAG TPA: ribonuclease HII [Rhizobiaceae bacterium]|nr:ribonuclease HII [Rhizobiaceae bacterium]